MAGTLCSFMPGFLEKRANGTLNKPVSMRCNYRGILSFTITGGFSQPYKRLLKLASGNLYKT